MKFWQFGKPKTPGFGIDRGYYLTVLSSKSVLPPILALINPQGEGGAVVGFGAPLASDAPKDSLAKPLERGAYAIASKDRKTVLRMLVLSKEEAGFDPEPFLRSELAQDLEPELLTRIRATWTVGQLSFESHDPMVYPAIDFLLEFASRFADMSDGVVADPISRRYLLPERVIQHPRFDPRIDAREVIGLAHRDRPDGLHLFTLGMVKFDLPEFEIVGLETDQISIAEALLVSLCQQCLIGNLAATGDRIGAPGYEFEIREGGFDRGLWEGIKVFELLPPSDKTAAQCISAWAESIKRA